MCVMDEVFNVGSIFYARALRLTLFILNETCRVSITDLTELRLAEFLLCLGHK